jgi:hypothetical protein
LFGSTTLGAAAEYLALKQYEPALLPPAADAELTHVADLPPLVATFETVLTQAEAQLVVETAQPLMRRAGVTTDDGKGGRPSTGRTNDLCWIKHDHSLAIWNVVQRIAEIVGIPSEHAEKLQVIHYSKSQRCESCTSQS